LDTDTRTRLIAPHRPRNVRPRSDAIAFTVDANVIIIVSDFRNLRSLVVQMAKKTYRRGTWLVGQRRAG